MFTKKDLDEAMTEYQQEVVIKLQKALPHMDEILVGKIQGLTVRGVSVTARKNGGWLAIIRVSLVSPDKYPDLWDGYDAGDYVTYGGGVSALGAIAKAEAELASGRAGLTPDRYSDNPGAASGGSAKKGKKRVVK